MNNREIINQWLSVFGKDVDAKLIKSHVTSYGNHLWHIFTWGNVPCFEGDTARHAFDELQYTEAIKFCGGYSNRMEDVCVVEKVSAKVVDEDTNRDVYLVAKDFSWTYVRTHENGLDPYLCVMK